MDQQALDTVVDTIKSMRDSNDPGIIWYLRRLHEILSRSELARVKKALLR